MGRRMQPPSLTSSSPPGPFYAYFPPLLNDTPARHLEDSRALAPVPYL